MVTLISFFVILLGAFNWFSIGLMQYDFIAGIFGTQSSFLSRAVYILVGFAAIWFVIMAFVQKGRIKINDNGFKKDPLKSEKRRSHATVVEADKEYINNNNKQNERDFDAQNVNINNYDQEHDFKSNSKSPFE